MHKLLVPWGRVTPAQALAPPPQGYLVTQGVLEASLGQGSLAQAPCSSGGPSPAVVLQRKHLPPGELALLSVIELGPVERAHC